MSRGVNKVILVGNCGKDPETRYSTSGAAITNITVATSEEWADKNTNQKQSKTEWHNVSFFNRLAEVAGQYLKKGSKVYIEGKLQTRKWQGQDGQDRYTTEIIANEMQMLDSRNDSAAPQQQGNYQQQAPQQPPMQQAPQQMQQQGGYQQPPPAQQAPQQGQQHHTPAPPNIDQFDDDIPF